MDLKRETEAYILKYIIKKNNLIGHNVLEEVDSEDVRFNFELLLSNTTLPNGKIVNDINSVSGINPKDVTVESELSIVCALQLMSLQEHIKTGALFQNGWPTITYKSIINRHTLKKPILTIFDVFLYIRSLFKQDDLSYFILFACQKQGHTFFSKLMKERLLSKWNQRKFLTTFWDQAITWLTKA